MRTSAPAAPSSSNANTAPSHATPRPRSPQAPAPRRSSPPLAASAATASSPVSSNDASPISAKSAAPASGPASSVPSSLRLSAANALVRRAPSGQTSQPSKGPAIPAHASGLPCARTQPRTHRRAQGGPAVLELRAWPPPYLQAFKRTELFEHADHGPDQARDAGLELLRRELKREIKRAHKREEPS